MPPSIYFDFGTLLLKRPLLHSNFARQIEENEGTTEAVQVTA